MTLIKNFLTMSLLFGMFACGHEEKKPIANTGDATPRMSTLEIQTKVFDVHCVKCHNAEHGAKGIDLSSSQAYEGKLIEIVDSRYGKPLILPGNPQESALYLSIADGSMPKRSDKLPVELLRDIENWILGM